MQPWRSKSASKAQLQSYQQGQRIERPTIDESVSRGMPPRQYDRKHKSGSVGTIAETPFRQARLKPPPVGNSASSETDIPIQLLSSPSRGIDVGIDASQDLTNPNTQQLYRQHISLTIRNHVDRFGNLQKSTQHLFPIRPPGSAPMFKEAPYASEALSKDALKSLQEVMLLVRRLREGCVASNRLDGFAQEVYALSTLLSILIGDNIQLSSSVSRLVDLIGFSQRSSTAVTCNDMNLVLSGRHDDLNRDCRIDVDLASSLLLLWSILSGGQAERIGGKQEQRRIGRSSSTFHAHRQAMNVASVGNQVQFVDQCQKALATEDLMGLRLLVLQCRSNNVWHEALLRRCIDDRRHLAWTTLRKAYMHLTIDPALVDASKARPSLSSDPNDWLERVLLIDLELMQLTADELTLLRQKNSVKSQPHSSEGVPEQWDDEGDEDVEQIGNALQATSLQDDAAILRIRSHRLAAAFSAYGLPETEADPRATSELMDRDNALYKWHGRIVTQAGLPAIKLR